MSKNYEIPSFVRQAGKSSPDYKAWLDGRASAHRKRDHKRWETTCSVEDYREAIHNAVVASKGMDGYTGESLAWNLIGVYDNEESKKNRVLYRRQFAMMPTVDHDDPVSIPEDMKAVPKLTICALRTNDCKSHLTRKELMEFSKKVLGHQKVGH
jgi:hypothetical protein